MKMKGAAAYILLLCALVSAVSLVPPVAAQREPAIPSGYVEIARERKGDTIFIYLGTPQDKNQYTKVIERLAAVDGAIAKIGAELTTQRAKVLPAFGEKYAEWLELDDEARKEVTANGVNLLEVAFISSMRILTEKGRAISDEDLNRIWDEYRNSPLAQDDYQFLSRRLAKNAEAIHKWRGAADFLEWCQHVHNVNSFLSAYEREKYGKALVSLLGLALNDPRAHILVAELEFVGAVAMAYATESAASQEITRILNMQTQHLAAVTHNCNKMKDLVKERNRLRAERAGILEKASAVKP
jgi:hypothetical protein